MTSHLLTPVIRTYAVLKALSGNLSKGQPVDYLYVDEVQDNLIIDIILLRILCRNADGLFWAGDTAQTISAGSSFRFADLKAFVHRTEAERCMAIQKSYAKPDVFELAVNYRSHSGIVNCAQLVVKLITEFGRTLSTHYKPERAMLGARYPSFSRDGAKISTCFRGDHELGAEQCILVRDDAIRKQIRKQFGDIAVILTLQESKGLEFDDVFLYNFLEDSTATFSQWRTVLMAHSNRENSLPRDMGGSPHSVLCTEPEEVIPLDHSRKCEPMKRVSLTLDRGTPTFASTPRSRLQNSGARSGYKLFDAGQFQEAIRCFQRANLPTQLQISQAYRLREVAMLTLQAGERQKAYLNAAEAFVHCAREVLGTEKTSFYGEAAKCYALADNVLIAARFYRAADDFAGAAGQYHKAGRFDEIVQILDRHPEKITASYRNKLLHICVVHYYRHQLRPPVPLFTSTENELTYLESQGLHKERIYLLESYGRFLEAADVHLGLGQRCGAIETLLKDQKNPDALQRAVDLALDSLWHKCSFDMPVQDILKNKGSDAYEVLGCINDIPLDRLDISDSGQIRFFRAMQKSPFTEEVYQLGEEFSARGEDAMALITFNVLSSQLPTLHSARASEFDVFLRRFERYVRLLVSIVSGEIPFLVTDSKVMKVFGIVQSSDCRYSVTAGTFLYRSFRQSQHLSTEINDLLRAQLRAHLRKKVVDENNVSYISQAFSTQCPYSVLHGHHCHRKHCNHQHERKAYLTAASYNMKINLHLQQIRILDLMFSTVGSHVGTGSQAALDRLYAAIYCPAYVEGSIADLDWSTLRNAAECVPVVREWIQKAINYLEPVGRPTNHTDYLMSAMRITCLHTAFGGEGLLQHHVSRESCRVPYGEQSLLQGSNVSADVVGSLTELDPTRGVRALRFLLQNGVGMDLSVVCNFAEEMCSTLISSLHPFGSSSPLHDLLVPRRWIMKPEKRVVRRDIIQDFLHCLRRLMDILRSGKVHKKFDLPPNQGFFVDIIVARMCRMLCILGYNVREVGISKAIAEILLLPPLEVDNVRNLSPRNLRQLVNLRRQYLETIQGLDDGLAIQDLIHLVHKNGRYLALPISPRIPQLVFEDVADISRQMNRAPAF
ncbi:hypothetical protein EDC04DRAFT_2959379 [Pisolithus marmoratus]|nr:hypothetical protein EDC04DRAFT_2959379 [Pisolithus marmoratus]